MKSVLYVLWRLPQQPLPEAALVLSFLPPGDEDSIVLGQTIEIICGRQASVASRGEAVQLYREIVAQIGLAPAGRGTSLRREMQRAGEASDWWYHMVANRDSESSDEFEMILQVLVIRAVAAQRAAARVVLVGAPGPLVAVVAQVLPVERSEATRTTPGALASVIALVGSRVRYLIKYIHQRFALWRYYRLPDGPYNVAFSSFWDWGFKWDEKTERYADRYFKALPHLLVKGGAGVRWGYFAWFDPHYEPSQRGRALAAVLAPLRKCDNVVLLQALLGVRDLVKALCDIAVPRAMLRALSSDEFRHSLRRDGVDWLPLFEPVLRRGCFNAQIPHCRLVALATERAGARYQPKLTLNFLEHFPHSRAFYEGMRRSGAGAANWAMQHAGWCREKTFYFLHPQFEMLGQPDGCCVPHPDHVFAMGTLGRELFLECGYRAEQVVLTGSARYDHIAYFGKAEPKSPQLAGAGEEKKTLFRVLLACSLEVTTEVDMVEAAALAARSLPQIELRVRNHPSSRVEAHPHFARNCSHLVISRGTLDEDIAWADVVLFSCSTVAEEAVLKGKPAWQWLPTGLNGSALVEAATIPSFGSVSALRGAFTELVAAGRPPSVSVEARDKVANRLFAPADGRAAERIAAACLEYLAGVHGLRDE